MTEKRFTIKEFSTLDAMDSIDVICDEGIELPTSTACDLLNALHEENKQLKQSNSQLAKVNREGVKKVQKLAEENEQLKQQKPFLKINDDYFIQYGDDKELFNLHKPSDIRSLIYLINRENGYDELECEYNEEGYGND